MDILFYMAAPYNSDSTGMKTHITEILGNLDRVGHTIRFVDGSAYFPAPKEKTKKAAAAPAPGRPSLFGRIKGNAAVSPFRGEMLLVWSFLKEAREFLLAVRTVRRQRPDVIYRRLSHYNSDYLIARWFNIPVVKEVNAIGSEELRITRRADRLTLWLYRYMERYSLRRADRLIVVTPELKELISSRYGVAPELITVIQNGANTDLFRPIDQAAARERVGIARDIPVVCFVGLLKRWQGVETLIRAMPSVLEQFPAARLLIVGDGDMKDELAAVARKTGVAASVTFTGRVPYEDVPFYMNAADVCAAPFIRELDFKGGLCSLKMYEYLACGRAVVMSRLSGTGAMEQGKCLSLFEPENVPELAAAIAELLEEPGLRERMGAAGRKYVEECQSWQQVADRVADVLCDGKMHAFKCKRIRKDENDHETQPGDRLPHGGYR